MDFDNLERITTYELAEMICNTLTPENLEHISTDALSKITNSTALVLRRLPNVPLGELSSLTDKLLESNIVSDKNLDHYELYKGIPVYLYQEERPDEWRASVEWYGRLANVDLEACEKPTRETVIKAAHKLINILEDTRDNGLVWPEGYFTCR